MLQHEESVGNVTAWSTGLLFFIMNGVHSPFDSLALQGRKISFDSAIAIKGID